MGSRDNLKMTIITEDIREVLYKFFHCRGKHYVLKASDFNEFISALAGVCGTGRLQGQCLNQLQLAKLLLDLRKISSFQEQAARILEDFNVIRKGD